MISAISKMFPNSTLDVVATDNELNCFVSKGFSRIRLDKLQKDAAALRKLGQLQVQSLPRIKSLVDAGLPDQTPRKLLCSN